MARSNLEFVVVENPTIERTVSIAENNRPPKKLYLEWSGIDMEEAADLLEDYERQSAFWVDDENGDPLSLDEAAEDFIYLRDTEGNEFPSPRLHDYVRTRKLKERLQLQMEFLREVIMGNGTSGDLLEEGLLNAWTLANNGEPMDFHDPDVYDSVFKQNKYFFPILRDFIEMLGEVSGAKDKEKNSKDSAKSGQKGRAGRMRA